MSEDRELTNLIEEPIEKIEMQSDRKIKVLFGTSALVFISLLFLSFCTKGEPQEITETAEYRQAVSDFFVSLGAAQTDEARFAFNKMNDVAQAFPEEAAAWANLGVMAMRQGNYELAVDRMERARAILPEHPEILYLSSIVESLRGDTDASIRFLRDGISSDPVHFRMLFALAQELEREDDRTHAEEIASIYDTLLTLDPSNQALLLEATRFASKTGDLVQVENFLADLKHLSETWDQENRSQLELVEEVLNEGSSAELTLELSFLRNTLQSDEVFRTDLLRVELPPTDLGFLITEFLILPQPEIRVAAPDLDISFPWLPLELPVSESAWLRGVTLLEDLPPFPVSVANGQVVVNDETVLEFPGRTDQPLPPFAGAEIDYNYDFRNDLAFAGSNGFRLYRVDEELRFTDVTGELGIPASVINGNYFGIWAFDIEMDGDLDLLLAPQDGTPFVLRNNGDGTFTETTPFRSIDSVRNFLWADLDGDGTPEATMLTEGGEVITFLNLRGGDFSDGILLTDEIVAIAVADLSADGQFEIVTLSNEGRLESRFYSLTTGEWNERTLYDQWNDDVTDHPVQLFIADIDNNGALDLIVSSLKQTRIWLGDEELNYLLLEEVLPGGVINIFDVDGNDRLDLLVVSAEMEPAQLKNEGTRNYAARLIRARASGELGDQRINSFGIGGEMEVRSGLLYQKSLISSPIVHFGLGEHQEADMLRIIWPNGSVQTEFAELGMGATIFNEQILKGSCPWLFTNDGEEVHFITDALWRSPLGLRINAQETAGVIQTFDRVRIPGERLQPVDGVYDVRVTAELWETHFFDYVELIAVDHPVGTEVFVDERFVFPAPDLSTRIAKTPVPVQSVYDQWNNDLTEQVSRQDNQYIAPFIKTPYQGLVEEHSIVITLNDRNENFPEYLVMHGWLRPTDSSINLALSQGSFDPPSFMKVEVSDGYGGWNMLNETFGWPAGKLKTVLLDLEDAFSHSEGRQVRLTTTAEIYWDSILQAEKTDASLFRENPLQPVKMDLRYRGFSEWSRADSISPKLPDYHYISSTLQRWRDLEGFHTRFGDVSELLAEVDDRYVIMNAGDEMILHFAALPEPEEGYTRSFIFVSDGWVKDGDYNTEASATVLPLPYHGMADYDYSSGGRLQDDPVFQRFREDWINYHTRYITPHLFRTALLFDSP